MMSQNQREFAVTIGICIAFVGAVAAVLPHLARTSNCGGNSAALTACRSVAVSFHLIASERGRKSVSVADLTENERTNFEHLPGLNWLGNAKVLVVTNSINFDRQTNQIVAVCDAPYDNVPQKMFGKALMTHAVAFAVGTTQLIPISKFLKLNLDNFVDVRSLQSANSNRSDFSVEFNKSP